MNRNSQFHKALTTIFSGCVLFFFISCLAGCGSPSPDTLEVPTGSGTASTSVDPHDIAPAKAVATPKQAIPDCRSVPKDMTLGPSLSIEAIEAESLRMGSETIEDPNGVLAPIVAIDLMDKKWIEAKRLVQSSGSLHRYEYADSGGYVALQGDCIMLEESLWVHR